jgi:hypothetical protein
VLAGCASFRVVRLAYLVQKEYQIDPARQAVGQIFIPIATAIFY